MNMPDAETLQREFEDEFNERWDNFRVMIMPFKPRKPFMEQIKVVSQIDDYAIIKRMDEDGEMYLAEVPVADIQFKREP